jgi:acetyl-CoA acetyltransferase
MTAGKGEESAVISGAGQSRVGRRLGIDGLTLAVESVREAAADAGIAISDIDGISTYPGQTTVTPGYSPVGVTELKEALRLKLNWFTGARELPGQIGAVINAVAAVHAGFAKHVVCFRTLTESSSQNSVQRASLVGAGKARIDDDFQWRVPFRASSAANWVALMATRYMHDFGATREQLGQIPLACRRHAMLNEKAVYRTPADDGRLPGRTNDLLAAGSLRLRRPRRRLRRGHRESPRHHTGPAQAAGAH